MKKPKRILAPANWVVDEKKRKKRPLTTDALLDAFEKVEMERLRIAVKRALDGWNGAIKGWRNTLILLSLTFTAFIASCIYSLTT